MTEREERLRTALCAICDMAGSHTVTPNDPHPAGFLAIYRTADAALAADTREAQAAPLELPQTERERLHVLIEQCNSLIDPEEYPELRAEIDAVLTPCDEAGVCVAPSERQEDR